jgi:hypothetical protein
MKCILRCTAASISLLMAYQVRSTPLAPNAHDFKPGITVVDATGRFIGYLISIDVVEINGNGLWVDLAVGPF